MAITAGILHRSPTFFPPSPSPERQRTSLFPEDGVGFTQTLLPTLLYSLLRDERTQPAAETRHLAPRHALLLLFLIVQHQQRGVAQAPEQEADRGRVGRAADRVGQPMQSQRRSQARRQVENLARDIQNAGQLSGPARD